jgi:hypothetical protein
MRNDFHGVRCVSFLRLHSGDVGSCQGKCRIKVTAGRRFDCGYDLFSEAVLQQLDLKGLARKPELVDM